MGLSQPALSASLARLRRHFGDELLSRAGNEYRLTPLAVQLKDLARIALSGRGAGVHRPAGVRPGVVDPRVHPPGQRLRGRGPRRHRRRPAGRGGAAHPAAAEHALPGDRRPGRPGRCCPPTSSSCRTGSSPTCPAGTSTATSGSAWSPATTPSRTWSSPSSTWRRCRGWSPTTGRPRRRRPRGRCACSGIEPHVQVVIENFLTVPALVAGSDRIALLQRRLVDLLPLDIGIRALPCPFDVGPLIEAMWWHPVYDDDPEHALPARPRAPRDRPGRRRQPRYRPRLMIRFRRK